MKRCLSDIHFLNDCFPTHGWREEGSVLSMTFLFAQQYIITSEGMSCGMTAYVFRQKMELNEAEILKSFG